MKTGDLVLRKFSTGALPGVVVGIVGDVATVYWGHRGETHMYYFHKLEVVNEAA